MRKKNGEKEPFRSLAFSGIKTMRRAIEFTFLC